MKTLITINTEGKETRYIIGDEYTITHNSVVSLGKTYPIELDEQAYVYDVIKQPSIRKETIFK